MFQVVTAEILMASETGCPLEVHKISIDRCDEMFDEDCHGDTWMPFYRDDDELDLRSEISTQPIHFPSYFRAKYDSGTGQSPNSPREQVQSYNYRIEWCALTLFLAAEPHDELDRRELRVLEPGGVGEHAAQLPEREPQVDGIGGGGDEGDDAAVQPGEGAALQRAQSARPQETDAGEDVR